MHLYVLKGTLRMTGRTLICQLLKLHYASVCAYTDSIFYPTLPSTTSPSLSNVGFTANHTT